MRYNLSVAYADTPEILPPGTDYGMDTLDDNEYGAKLGEVLVVGEPEDLRSTGRKLIEQMDKVAPAEPVDVAGPAQRLSHEQGWTYESLTDLAYSFVLDADNGTRAAFLAHLRHVAEGENNDAAVVDGDLDADEPSEG